jgi:hypothetical protein
MKHGLPIRHLGDNMYSVCMELSSGYIFFENESDRIDAHEGQTYQIISANLSLNIDSGRFYKLLTIN